MCAHDMHVRFVWSVWCVRYMLLIHLQLYVRDLCVLCIMRVAFVIGMMYVCMLCVIHACDVTGGSYAPAQS